MNAFRFPIAAPALVVVSALLASNADAATPRCEAPTFRVDRIACAMAKQGPDALRRFIQRTQSIYGLYFWDYMSESDLDRHAAQRQARALDQIASDEGPAQQASMRP